jgi:hypothetical protein
MEEGLFALKVVNQFVCFLIEEESLHRRVLQMVDPWMSKRPKVDNFHSTRGHKGQIGGRNLWVMTVGVNAYIYILLFDIT